MDEMSMTSQGVEMTLGGVTLPLHDLKLDFKNMPRIPRRCGTCRRYKPELRTGGDYDV